MCSVARVACREHWASKQADFTRPRKRTGDRATRVRYFEQCWNRRDGRRRDRSVDLVVECARPSRPGNLGEDLLDRLARWLVSATSCPARKRCARYSSDIEFSTVRRRIDAGTVARGRRQDRSAAYPSARSHPRAKPTPITIAIRPRRHARHTRVSAWLALQTPARLRRRVWFRARTVTRFRYTSDTMTTIQ